jgi:EF-hand domain
MHQTTLLLFLTFLLTLLPRTRLVHAMCCLSDAGGDCGDNSNGTPCCGYKKCNGFCCHCEGVQLIRQEVELKSGTKFYTTISVITAKPGTTWTCRQDHITKYPPHLLRNADNLPTATDGLPASQITPGPDFQGRRPPPSGHGDRQPPEECDDILMKVSGGSGNVSLEEYLKYFNVSDVDSPMRDAVIDKFRKHDQDGDGFLTKDEIELMVDMGEH